MQIGFVVSVRRLQYDGQSLTQWVRDLAPRLELTESSLWRAFSAYRDYVRLAQRYEALPTIEQLPRRVSAECIELLAKIDRVAPIQEFSELAKKAVAGEVTRERLRQIWGAYKSDLNGRTARGRNSGIAKVESKHRHLDASLLMAADQLEELLANEAGRATVIQVMTKLDVMLPNSGQSLSEDTVVAYQEAGNDELKIACLIVDAAQAKPPTKERLRDKAQYFDSIWTVGDNETIDVLKTRTPGLAGVIICANGRLQLERRPKPMLSVGHRSWEMVKLLVPKMLASRARLG